MILFDQSVFWLGQDLDQRIGIKILKRRNDRQAPDKLGYKSELQQILGLALLKDLTGPALVGRRDMRTKADALSLQAVADDLFKTRKRSTTYEQDIRRIDLQELLLRMFAAALRRNAGDGSLHHLEQRLLHAFARNVAGNRGVLSLARDLVDLVDIDNAALGAFYIIIGCLEQLEDDILDILPHIAGLSQGRRVSHRKRNVEDAGERLGKQRLAATGGPDEEDVRLGQLDVRTLLTVVQTLVVIVHRNRENALGFFLANDIVIEDVTNFLGRGYAAVLFGNKCRFRFLADDVVAEIDAFVADEHGRPRDQLAHFVLRLAAKGAIQSALRIAAAEFSHQSNPRASLRAGHPSCYSQEFNGQS